MISAIVDLRAQLINSGLRPFKAFPNGTFSLYNSPRIRSFREEFEISTEMKSDIFGLGLIAFEMLTLQIPYYKPLLDEGVSEVDISNMIHQEHWRPDILQDAMTEDQSDLIQRMWHPNFETRPEIDEIILAFEIN